MKLPSVCEQTNDGVIICDVGNKKTMMKYCEWELGTSSICKGKDGKEYSFPDVL